MSGAGRLQFDGAANLAGFVAADDASVLEVDTLDVRAHVRIVRQVAETLQPRISVQPQQVVAQVGAMLRIDCDQGTAPEARLPHAASPQPSDRTTAGETDAT